MSRRIHPLRSKRTGRRGFTLTEVTVAMLILAAAIVATTQLMAAVAARRLASERETVARQETANLMERVFALPWADLTEEEVSKLSISETCQGRLKDARLQIAVESTAGTPAGRQIHVELTWLDSGRQDRRRTKLTAWRFASEESEP